MSTSPPSQSTAIQPGFTFPPPDSTGISGPGCMSISPSMSGIGADIGSAPTPPSAPQSSHPSLSRARSHSVVVSCSQSSKQPRHHSRSHPHSHPHRSRPRHHSVLSGTQPRAPRSPRQRPPHRPVLQLDMLRREKRLRSRSRSRTRHGETETDTGDESFDEYLDEQEIDEQQIEQIESSHGRTSSRRTHGHTHCQRSKNKRLEPTEKEVEEDEDVIFVEGRNLMNIDCDSVDGGEDVEYPDVSGSGSGSGSSRSGSGTMKRPRPRSRPRQRQRQRSRPRSRQKQKQKQKQRERGRDRSQQQRRESPKQKERLRQQNSRSRPKPKKARRGQEQGRSQSLRVQPRRASCCPPSTRARKQPQQFRSHSQRRQSQTAVSSSAPFSDSELQPSTEREPIRRRPSIAPSAPTVSLRRMCLDPKVKKVRASANAARRHSDPAVLEEVSELEREIRLAQEQMDREKEFREEEGCLLEETNRSLDVSGMNKKPSASDGTSDSKSPPVVAETPMIARKNRVKEIRENLVFKLQQRRRSASLETASVDFASFSPPDDSCSSCDDTLHASSTSTCPGRKKISPFHAKSQIRLPDQSLPLVFASSLRRTFRSRVAFLRACLNQTRRFAEDSLAEGMKEFEEAADAMSMIALAVASMESKLEDSRTKVIEDLGLSELCLHGAISRLLLDDEMLELQPKTLKEGPIQIAQTAGGCSTTCPTPAEYDKAYVVLTSQSFSAYRSERKIDLVERFSVDEAVFLRGCNDRELIYHSPPKTFLAMMCNTSRERREWMMAMEDLVRRARHDFDDAAVRASPMTPMTPSSRFGSRRGSLSLIAKRSSTSSRKSSLGRSPLTTSLSGRSSDSPDLTALESFRGVFDGEDLVPVQEMTLFERLSFHCS